MQEIVLISCGSAKQKVRTKAKDMYTSSLFKYSLQYAELLKPNKTFIISAKYGLLRLDEEIEPYDVTLSNIPKNKRLEKPNLKVLNAKENKVWAKKVIGQLNNIGIDLNNDKVIILAGKDYYKNLILDIQKYELPMANVNMFNRVSWLKERCDK